MEKNGSIFIKLGQHLTSLEYMLPREWCDTFIPLQDKCPVSSINSIEEMVKNDTGHSISEHFSSFDPVPIGAASLAQVHKAVLRDTGQEVAVKVQHPALDTWSQLDIALTRLTFATVKRFFPDYDLTWLSEELEMSLPQELDFEREGANARRARSYFHQLRNGPPLIIPDVIWARRRILVMEFIAGRRIDDLAYLNTQGIDRGDVSAALAYIFNEMIFGTNAPLHCDPHAGNIAVRHNPKRSTRNFDIILYDHGLYRDIPPQLRVSYAQLWLAVLDGDEERMRRYAAEAAGVTDEYFPLFASAITGRDYKVVKGAKSGGGVATPRTAAEIEVMSGKMDNSLFIELVQLLGRMPRIILLILKTNDLSESHATLNLSIFLYIIRFSRFLANTIRVTIARSLDASLQTHDGAIRNFLILARFASRAVLDEELRRWRGDTSDNSRMTEPVNNHDTKSSLYTKTPYEPKNVNLNPKTDIKPSFLFRILPLHGFGSVFSAWVGHVRVVALLNVYEFWLHLRSFWVRAFT